MGMMKILRELFLVPVHIYRIVLSPLKGMATCRYEPSCSAYFTESVRKFGIMKGSVMGTARILRCRNSYMGGPDPVPQTWSWKTVRNGYIVYRKPKGFDRENRRK